MALSYIIYHLGNKNGLNAKFDKNKMDLYDEVLKQIEAARRELLEEYGIQTQPPQNLKIEKL